MNANFTPKVFPRTAGKTKSYVETNFFLDHPRLENLKKFREGIRLATGDGLLPDGSPAPPLLGEYLKNGPTEEFKAKLSALRKKDRAPDAADEAALATFLLAAGSAESGDFDGALEFFRDFPRDGTRTARALKAVAGEALVARFLENDLFDEARDVLDLMDAESWGMKRLDNLPIELFKVVEAGPAPNPDRNDPDDPDDLDEPRKAFSAMTGENREGRGEVPGKTPEKDQGVPAAAAEGRNPADSPDSVESAEPTESKKAAPAPPKPAPPLFTLLSDPAKDDPESGDDAMARAFLKLAWTDDPLGAKVRAASNLLFAYGLNGLSGDAESLHETLVKDSRILGDPGALREIKKARAYSLAFLGKETEAFALVDSPITLGPGNNKILATVLLTLMKIYGSPRHVELARARLDELWAIDDRKLENAGGYKARACGILLNHYKDLQDFNKAKNMYTHMANLDFDHDTILERFYSTIDIIIHQAANGDPVMALNLYNPLSHLKKFREYNYQRVKAGAALTTAFAEQGMLEEAQGLFDLLATLEVSRGLDMDDLSKDPLGLVRAGVDLARTHERDLFHHENGKEGADLAILHRAECALALMEAYAERYDVNSVKMIHDSLKLPNPNLDFTQAIASLSFGLFKTYLRVGDVSSALEYYLDELENELPFDEGNFLRCTMACHLMLAESGEKGLNLALRIYHGCRFVGDGPYAKEARATVSGLMVRILSSRGSTLKKAHEVFSSDRFFRDTEGFQEVRAKGALGLADAFVRKGSFGKAKKLYETGLFAAAALDDLPLKLMVMGRLVKDSCLRGNLDFARKLFEDFPVTLPATLKKMAAHRVMASITLNRAYRDAGNKEGIEFMRDCFANFDKNELRLLRGFEKQGLIELRNVFPAGKGKKKPRNGKK